jgi:hypothetical protein
LKYFEPPKAVLRENPNVQLVNLDIFDIVSGRKIPTGKHYFKTHSFPPRFEDLPLLNPHVKFLTVSRDPRDAIVSNAFYLARLPRENGGWNEKNSTMEDEAKVIKVIREGEFILSRIFAWHRFPLSYDLKYEDLLVDPVGEIKKVLEFLNLKRSEDTIRYFVDQHSFRKKAGRGAGVEDKQAFFRKGISKDWNNYFSHECVKFFRRAYRGAWNKLLVEMGYEKRLDWFKKEDFL